VHEEVHPVPLDQRHVLDQAAQGQFARRGAPPGLLVGQFTGGEPQEVPVLGQHREQVGPLGIDCGSGRRHILLLCSDMAHASGHTGKVRS
jgi:hypothetical protein